MKLVERSEELTKKESVSVKRNANTRMRMMNKYQQGHLDGTFDVHKPIEAYTEEWVHETDKHGRFVRAYPKVGTRKRQDLPSLAEQWRVDAKSRSLSNEQSTDNR
jgi:hypothetical protein